ncbi:hypothetical protein [Lysinibacillus xylanilyticus]|uniref:hypothetical protein n=1 Tax=Lysinibacillus xylanilyticus TaxID=582475 RepID=UPI003CFDF6DC
MGKTENYLKQLFVIVVIAMFAFASIFSTSIVVSANSEVDLGEVTTNNLPSDAVITQNDDRITEITYMENGGVYTTSIDKELEKMYLEYNGIKYEMIVEAFESDIENEESKFLGHLVNIETGKIIEFEDLHNSKSEIGITPSFAWVAPLAMPVLTKALELLLVGASMIYVANSSFVIASEATQMTSKYKENYFAAWIYYPNHTNSKDSYVVIGQGISSGEAEARLMVGQSTFARTEALAKSIFKSLDRGPEQHGPFPDFLPHYHGKVPNENKPGQNISSNGHSWYLGNIWK